jgi:hypothetical protein
MSFTSVEARGATIRSIHGNYGYRSGINQTMTAELHEITEILAGVWQKKWNGCRRYWRE